MKKIILTIAFVVATLWADDENNNSRIKSAVVKMQTLVGETAVNNILKAYFAGKHEISVKDMGNITLTLNDEKFGIDIQENDDIVFGYDMTITSDFQSSLSNISGGRISGELNIKGAISAKTVKRVADNAVEKTKSAIVILLDLNSAIEKMLNKHGIKEVPIMSAIKDFFLKKEAEIDGKIELWRQEYSTLLNVYINKVEAPLDLKILDVNLNLSLNNDNIVVDFEAEIQSEKQYFWMEGNYKDFANMSLNSNKEFQLIEVDLVDDIHKTGRNPSLFAVVKCSNISKERRNFFNLKEVCGEFPEKVPYLYGFFRVRTKHGGILLFSRRIK